MVDGLKDALSVTPAQTPILDDAYDKLAHSLAENFASSGGIKCVLEDEAGNRLFAPLDTRAVFENLSSFRTLMLWYRCANMEIETKLNVLNAEFSLTYNRNPFESIRSRIKEPQSILEKMRRKRIPFSVENIEKYLTDVAGIRVICSFPKDIYIVRDMLLRQDDITLVEEKDYIQVPKPNGYRSLHLILEVPIFLAEEKRIMKVEVQLRTIAMDFWASLEHKLQYKKALHEATDIGARLKSCAEASAALDLQMQQIQEEIDEKN